MHIFKPFIYVYMLKYGGFILGLKRQSLCVRGKPAEHVGGSTSRGVWTLEDRQKQHSAVGTDPAGLLLFLWFPNMLCRALT